MERRTTEQVMDQMNERTKEQETDDKPMKFVKKKKKRTILFWGGRVSMEIPGGTSFGNSEDAILEE